jgi:hypothetical protein
MATVWSAGIAHEDSLLLNHVAALPIGCARVDGMLVVKASADGVAFDDLIAHWDSGVLYAGWLEGLLCPRRSKGEDEAEDQDWYRDEKEQNSEVKGEPMSKWEASIYNGGWEQSRENGLCGSYIESILEPLQVRKATVVH